MKQFNTWFLPCLQAWLLVLTGYIIAVAGAWGWIPLFLWVVLFEKEHRARKK